MRRRSFSRTKTKTVYSEAQIRAAPWSFCGGPAPDRCIDNALSDRRHRTGIARGRFRCSTTIYFEAGRRELDRYCPFRRPVEPTSGGHAGADATFATVHGGAGKCCGRRQRHQSHHLWFRQVTKLQRHCPRYGFFAAQLDPRGGSRPGECAICRVRPSATRRQEICCCRGTDRPQERPHLLG